MLRILHVASGDLWAGAEVQVYQMVRALHAGREFDVRAVVLNDGQLVRELRGAGVEVTVLDERRLGFPRLLGRLAGLLGRSAVDVVHAHRYKENVLAALAARLAGVRALAVTVHGLPEPGVGIGRWRGALARWADRLALRCLASRVIAVSADIASRMEAVAPGRVSVVGNSVSLARFDAHDVERVRREVALPAGHRLVGAVGRMVPVKGMDLFVECAAELAKVRDDVTFVIVGDGPERGALEALARRRGLQARILLTGFRPDVHVLMSLFDVLVLPSRHEGIPTVLLEGLALGKPVVATAVGGIPEVVEDGVHGLLVPAADPRGWVLPVLRLLDHPAEARRLGACGRDHVRDNWSVERQANRLGDIYRRLAAADRARVPAPAEEY